jgi:hypothetical protein
VLTHLKDMRVASLCAPLFFILLPNSSLGSERPAWLHKPPRDDTQYKYYVGRTDGIKPMLKLSIPLLARRFRKTLE